MKKSFFITLLFSAALILAGCSNLFTDSGDSVSSFPEENDYYNKSLNFFIDKKPTSNVWFLQEGRSFKIGLDLYGQFNSISDLELSSSDRNVVEYYSNGFVSGKAIGTAELTVKSKTYNIDMKINMYVFKMSAVTVQDSYNQISFEIPEKVSAIIINRTINGVSEDAGAIEAKNTSTGMEKGSYVFKDYFVESGSKVVYQIVLYDSSNWGNTWNFSEVTSGNSTFGRLNFDPKYDSFNPGSGVLTLTSLSSFNKPADLKERYRIYFYLNKEMKNNANFTFDTLSTENDFSSSELYKQNVGKGIDVYGIGLAAWLYDESTYSSAGVYWKSTCSYTNPKILSYDPFVF